MSTLVSVAASAAPIAAGWSLHTLWMRRRIEAARRDPLTGLPTREQFTAHAERLARGGGVSMAFIDLDGFKRLNDTAGHAAGDAVLRATGARLDRWVQDNGGGAVARLGGDEFAAALRASSADDLVWSLGELHRALCAPVSHNGRELAVGASVGGVWSPRGVAVYLPVLLRRADEAMYTAKQNGGGVHATDRLTPVFKSVNDRRAGREGAHLSYDIAGGEL